MFAFKVWPGRALRLPATPRGMVCHDGFYCWQYQHSLRSLVLWSSPLLSSFLMLTCPTLSFYSVIRTRPERFPEFGLGCFFNYSFGLLEVGHWGPCLVLWPKIVLYFCYFHGLYTDKLLLCFVNKHEAT